MNRQKFAMNEEMQTVMNQDIQTNKNSVFIDKSISCQKDSLNNVAFFSKSGIEQCAVVQRFQSHSDVEPLGRI